MFWYKLYQFLGAMFALVIGTMDRVLTWVESHVPDDL